ncbi:MAG: hypothetical protein WD000_01595 [Thermodesulfobacteriota bacterium]
MLTEKDIKEFQEICREEVGREISKQEAMAYGTRLLDMYRTVYRPIPNNLTIKKD